MCCNIAQFVVHTGYQYYIAHSTLPSCQRRHQQSGECIYMCYMPKHRLLCFRIYSHIFLHIFGYLNCIFLHITAYKPAYLCIFLAYSCIFLHVFAKTIHICTYFCISSANQGVII